MRVSLRVVCDVKQCDGHVNVLGVSDQTPVADFANLNWAMRYDDIHHHLCVCLDIHLIIIRKRSAQDSVRKNNNMQLIELPPEILHNVLRAVDPLDLASLSLCCRVLHDFISDNRPLFKELYLQRLVSLTS